MDIELAYYRSPIGLLELRSLGNAITHILFVNSWKGLHVDEDKVECKDPSSPILKKCIKELNEYFDGKRKNFTIHTLQAGTEFQQKVWAELCNIPYGRTISYLELGKRIGDAMATRAVAKANSNNSVCIAVPCHRVIGSNGDLIGYSGELWRKKWLLEHESKIANGLQSLF